MIRRSRSGSVANRLSRRGALMQHMALNLSQLACQPDFVPIDVQDRLTKSAIEPTAPECRMILLNVISLKSDRKRRDLMQRQLEDLNLPFRFFDAVDGRKMTRNALTELAPSGGVDYCGILTPGEIGCALSHLALIREIAEGEHEYGAVVEDDVLILPHAARFLEEEYLRSLPAFDILQLDGNHPQRPRLTLSIAKIDGYEMCALTKCHHSMYALIYTRDAARKITSSISQVRATIDNMIFKGGLPGLRIVALRPSVVTHNNASPSVIGHRPHLEGVFSKLVREARRLLNWARRWRNFAQAWGLQSTLSLRLRRVASRPIKVVPISHSKPERTFVSVPFKVIT
jgi:GR25 family glycosyltransferase involved in LPS biosynthesis